MGFFSAIFSNLDSFTPSSDRKRDRDEELRKKHGFSDFDDYRDRLARLDPQTALPDTVLDRAHPTQPLNSVASRPKRKTPPPTA
jgi:hypothetical protein